MADAAETGLKDWLLRQALPLWLAHGVERAAGAFAEHLDPATLTCDAPFRRLRVAARQVFVFARAAEAGVPGAEAACRLGAGFLAERAALPGGGYGWRFGLDNRVTDPTLDLYDHAFVLLAWAAAAPLLGAVAAARARGVLDLLLARFVHPAGGFVESLPAALPRRQNPHMHLLEALLAAAERFGAAEYGAAARAVLDLFHARLLAADGTLAEEFSDALRPEPARLYAVEPGHHYEWAWLLARADAVLGAEARNAAAAAALLDFARRHGTHPETGDAIDAVRADGAPLRRSSRLWPQTERLKAERLAGGALHAAAVAGLARWLLPEGRFVERRDAAGGALPGPMPASSLYHLTCAILDPVPGTG